MTESDDCPFCQVASPVLEQGSAYAIYDRFPVTPGHMLIITRRHVSSWFDTTFEERQALLELADEAKDRLVEQYRPGGFNLGVNVGEVAGQTIGHVHLHLIPRYPGDVANPRGGVRGVIPERQHY